MRFCSDSASGGQIKCVFSAATAGAAYGGQTGYAVAPAATAATYGTQRAAATGYDTAYQAAAATQGKPNSVSCRVVCITTYDICNIPISDTNKQNHLLQCHNVM